MSTARPVCAIVGAGEGLGVSLARAFAADGADIALLGRKPESMQLAKSAAEKGGARTGIYQADARNPVALTNTLQKVQQDMGDIEILVYNPRGGLSFKPPLEVTLDELKDTLDLEVLGAFAAGKAVLPGMVARGRGTILYSSATAAVRGSRRNLTYAAGKFGLRGVSQSFSKAYASNGVHVVHVRLDCALDVPIVRELMGKQYDKEKTADPDDVARSYVWTHHQPRSAWSNEIELRPYTEDWTC